MDVNFILNNYYLKRKINVPRGTFIEKLFYFILYEKYINRFYTEISIKIVSLHLKIIKNEYKTNSLARASRRLL